ncbi:metalloregulator ArsR/SmtB family transcription factor [Lactobacillus rodentium]|uniref:Putative transcriptional regulator n=1 Tax=Lactobacillus rodentium TaxID=947835 RepID=A0A2Z6T6R1_9LACO|nr:metalloregulator ArsR/SmtB family transcription factor [Lactobacillus rodentium]MCR1894024.1 metalloregulator ArsR/SmtB family transcription factor [Lactobacillus rodentium]GBG04111.1 putative transcriptional regulator [Lactobacillus rodentium]
MEKLADKYQTAAFEQVVKIGKTFSNLTRIKILFMLDQGPKSVEELASQINMSVANTSKNLQILKQVNLVKEEKQKNFVIYHLTSKKVNELLSLLIDLSEESLPSFTELEDNLVAKTADLPHVDSKTLYDKLSSNEAYVLDLRPKDEFDNDHLPQAHNIDYHYIDEHLNELPSDQDIIVYCRGRLCGIANVIGQRLQELGHRVYTYNHTVSEWKKDIQ